MELPQKMKHELRAIGLAMLYFGCWIAALLLLKQLVLAEYRIAYHGFSLALIGALILSKVVLILEHVSLGAWVRARPAWVDVVLRTAMYAGGVAMVLALERSFEGRHEHGSFLASLNAGLHEVDALHVWVNTICLSGALLGYNVLSVIRRHLGPGGLVRMFTSPIPGERVAPATDAAGPRVTRT